MPNEIQELQLLAAHYRERVRSCTDMIKYVSGGTPDAFKLTFSVGQIPTLIIEIGDEDENFLLGLLMEWEVFHSRKLREIEGRLHSLQFV